MYDRERGDMRREVKGSMTDMSMMKVKEKVKEEEEEEEESSTTDSLAKKTADEIFDRMRKGENVSFPALLEGIVNAVMERERDYFLQSTEDYANGFYTRKLQMAMGRLNLKVPRVRHSKGWRPALLPARWGRVYRDYGQIVTAMMVNGYSQRQIRDSLGELDLPYSQEKIGDISAVINERLEDYRKMPLPEELFAVFIDAYHARLRDEDGKMKEISIFTALGIDLDGRKSILGYWVNEGGENKQLWIDVLQSLISRGATRVLLFVTDDFPGLKEVIARLYPYSDHQLCCVHLKRNLKKHLSKKCYGEVKEDLFLLFKAHDKEDGGRRFDAIADAVATENSELAERLKGRKDNYTAFLKYPQEVRTHVYTTNGIESVNSGLEYMRYDLGGYFPSRRSLDINYYIQIEHRNDGWLRRPVAAVSSSSYEIRQLFEMRFGIGKGSDQ
jgi:transposase-like protein